MRSNYHNPSQSEDSVTKISRSKSRNQMGAVNKIKEKVIVGLISRVDGIKDFIFSIFLNITIRTSPIFSVQLQLLRSKEQIACPQ